MCRPEDRYLWNWSVLPCITMTTSEISSIDTASRPSNGMPPMGQHSSLSIPNGQDIRVGARRKVNIDVHVSYTPVRWFPRNMREESACPVWGLMLLTDGCRWVVVGRSKVSSILTLCFVWRTLSYQQHLRVKHFRVFQYHKQSGAISVSILWG